MKRFAEVISLPLPLLRSLASAAGAAAAAHVASGVVPAPEM
jgi:hypothetical protein